MIGLPVLVMAMSEMERLRGVLFTRAFPVRMQDFCIFAVALDINW